MLKRAPHIDLTEEQTNLVKKLTEWYKRSSRQWFSYSGAAGTGKTTVIRAFIEELGLQRYIACAFVGKAVTVLSRQGLPASTIHSLIYHVSWIPVMDEKGLPVLNKDGNPKMKVVFSLKNELPGDLQLIIVDEATMVNDDLAEDILSFGIKTVFIGDNNQLPPVFGVSSVMLNPDFWLTKIMRQAENNPIIYLSQRVLKDLPLQYGIYGKSRVVPSVTLDETYTRYDAIIAGKNKVRDDINEYIRYNIKGVTSRLPVIGDKLICRQNDWDRSIEGNIYLTTGMTGIVTDIHRSLGGNKYMSIDFLPEISDEEFFNLLLDTQYIRMNYEDRRNYGFSRYEKFEYGYCVTCHACQGSQFDNVLFINQWFHDADLTKKIQYTAITRAIESIDIASSVYMP